MMHRHREKGVTLVELLTVMSIASMLLLYGLNSYFYLSFKARQTEALQNLAGIKKMVTTFILEHSDGFPLDSCENHSVGENYCTLSSWESTDPCEFANPVGFDGSCAHRYYYRLHINPANTRQFRIEAHEKPTKSFCPGNIDLRDKHYLNWCGKRCNFSTIDPATCTPVAHDCGDMWSCP